MTRAPEQPALNGLPRQRPDVDPAEAQDWRESMDGVVDHTGPRRARQLIPWSAGSGPASAGTRPGRTAI